MHEFLIVLGMFLIISGTLAIFAYIAMNTQGIGGTAGQKNNVQAGGIIMIGPIPFVFGTSNAITLAIEIVGILLFVVAIIFFFLTGRHTI